MFFVRTATERDLAAVSTLLDETWHATYDGIHGADRVSRMTAKWHSVASLKARMEARGAEFVVADDGRTIGGMGFAALSKEEPTLAILHQLAVLPRLRGQGLGRDLFAELETCFPDAGRMRVEVETQNIGAAAFFGMLGFKPVGKTGDCGEPGSGVAGVIYEKPLAG